MRENTPFYGSAYIVLSDLHLRYIGIHQIVSVKSRGEDHMNQWGTKIIRLVAFCKFTVSLRRKLMVSVPKNFLRHIPKGDQHKKSGRLGLLYGQLIVQMSASGGFLALKKAAS